MEEALDFDHDVFIPPLLALEHAIAIYTMEVYTYCGYNLKQTCTILEISEKQLVQLLELDEELDFS